jgi:hypothetical protein
MKLEFGKMEWLLLAAGLLVGGGAGTGITWKLLKKPTIDAPIIIKDATAEKQQDVVLQLTDLDLIKEACSSEFIVTQKQGPALCREMFCRMQQRGVDAKTGSNECESISNVSNKILIHNFCKESAITGIEVSSPITNLADDPPMEKTTTSSLVDETKLKACIEFFDRRI